VKLNGVKGEERSARPGRETVLEVNLQRQVQSETRAPMQEYRQIVVSPEIHAEHPPRHKLHEPVTERPVPMCATQTKKVEKRGAPGERSHQDNGTAATEKVLIGRVQVEDHDAQRKRGAGQRVLLHGVGDLAHEE